jgi:hypothetical protein
MSYLGKSSWVGWLLVTSSIDYLYTYNLPIHWQAVSFINAFPFRWSQSTRYAPCPTEPVSVSCNHFLSMINMDAPIMKMIIRERRPENSGWYWNIPSYNDEEARNRFSNALLPVSAIRASIVPSPPFILTLLTAHQDVFVVHLLTVRCKAYRIPRKHSFTHSLVVHQPSVLSSISHEAFSSLMILITTAAKLFFSRWTLFL